MNKHLLSVDEFKELTRPVSVHIDDDEVTAYIRESEDASIIPAVGYAVCKRLAEGEDLSDADKVLLDGGEWTDGKGVEYYCNGLKKATAYFAYARMVRSDGAILARTGFMSHGDEYSRHIEDVEKRKRYNDIMTMAEAYLSEVLMYYWRTTEEGAEVRKIRGSRARIKAIGE